MTENQRQGGAATHGSLQCHSLVSPQKKKGAQPSVLTLNTAEETWGLPSCKETAHRQYPLPGLLQSILSMRQTKDHTALLCLVCKIPVFMVHLDKARFSLTGKEATGIQRGPASFKGTSHHSGLGQTSSCFQSPQTTRVSFFRALKIPSQLTAPVVS